MTDILFVLENDMYVRNFVTSGVLNGLIAAHKEGKNAFSIVASELVEKMRDAIPSEFFGGQFTRIKKNIKYTYECNVASMRALRHLSKTYDIKTQKKLYASKHEWLYRLLANPYTAQHIRRYFASKFKRNESLESLIRQHQPKLVIFAVTGVEATGTELVHLSKQYGFKTLFLVNGWDNLSSKGVFPLLPDDMGVWGPQTFLHAIQIQGMSPSHTHLIGCSRYEDYLAQGQQALPSPFDFPYILFAGATVACDELRPLHLLDDSLSRLGIPNLKIIYRPHPWREQRHPNCADYFDPADFKHVILDPQIAAVYSEGKQTGQEGVARAEYPSLSYYPQLVKNATFVISPMSSMTLEAALFDIPTLVLAMDDGFHKIPSHLQAQYTHFEGGREIKGWHYVDTYETLQSQFEALLNQVQATYLKLRQPGLQHAMRYYLYQDTRSYQQRLTELVTALIG